MGAAMVFGEGRPEIGVLIELAKPIEDIQGLGELLWPTIKSSLC